MWDVLLWLGQLVLSIGLASWLAMKIARKEVRNRLKAEAEWHDQMPLQELIEAFQDALPHIEKVVELRANPGSQRPSGGFGSYHPGSSAKWILDRSLKVAEQLQAPSNAKLKRDVCRYIEYEREWSRERHMEIIEQLQATYERCKME